jgi:hypothetical protein
MYNEFYFIASIICALFIYMIDYGLGKPGDKEPIHSLFSFYTFWISKKTLQLFGEWQELNSQYNEQIKTCTSKKDKRQIDLQFFDLVFHRAKPFFTWQKVVGMCSICTHFWFTFIFFILVNIFCQKDNLIIFVLYFLLSHFFIRVLKKYF